MKVSWTQICIVLHLLSSKSDSPYRLCEGDGDVVGVLTPLVRGVAQDFHGDQVVGTARSAGGGRKRRRQGRTGGSRRGEATQGGALMDDYEDEVTRLRS